MGGAEFAPNGIVVAVGNAPSDVSTEARGEMRLATPGGRYQVRWDDDSVAPGILGMNRIVSDESLRRGPGTLPRR